MPAFRAFAGPPLRFLLLACFAVALAACESDDELAPAERLDRPVEELYNDAMDTLLTQELLTAAKKFEEVERQHPYSVWASKAQLMAGFAYYQANQYTDAINALERFIELHPGHPDVEYAYYLKALSYYEQISDVKRDQGMTEKALAALEDVTQRFPQSKYARDARLKADLARDHLAGKHMDIGRWYLRRGEYLAAINRFRIVVRDYQTTTHVPEALHRLVEAYLSLGVNDEAKATAAVLGHNYPGSEWYIDSYALLTGEDYSPEEFEQSWISDFWESVF